MFGSEIRISARDGHEVMYGVMGRLMLIRLGLGLAFFFCRCGAVLGGSGSCCVDDARCAGPWDEVYTYLLQNQNKSAGSYGEPSD